MANIIISIKNFFSEGHQRSLLAKKNIALSFLLKGGSVIIMLIMVPLTINYVNATQYGIWITLSSIIGWFSFFDVGFGHGLKNKLTEAIANGDEALAKSLVSTTYFILCIISTLLLFVFLATNYFIDWSVILNAPSSLASELSLVALIVFFAFCIQFVLQIINIVCAANQNTFLPTSIILLGNLLSLILIFILTKTTEGSLFYLCLSVGISPLIILVSFSLVLYKTSYSKYAPSYKHADFSYAKEIMKLGFKFFLIQIGLLFFYNTHNIIITQVIGPSAVTPFNVAFKYFGTITMISGIIMTPFWPAFTEAHVKKDYDWIKRTVKKLEKIGLLIFMLSIIMFLFSNEVYSFWVGEEIVIPYTLSFILAIYVALNTYRTIFCFFLNGVGKIKIQLYLVIISGLINIPLAIFLAKVMGVTGVILSTTILCAFAGIIEIIQYKKIISKTATGLWDQ